MRQVERAAQYLNKIDDKLMLLLKESNTDTLKRTLPKSYGSKDQFENTDELSKQIFTPQSSYIEVSKVSKSQFLEQPLASLRKEKFNDNIFEKQTTSTIMDRLKIIEGSYQNKITILEEDNQLLRKQFKNQKQVITDLEIRSKQLEDELGEYQQLNQQALTKKVQEMQQQQNIALQNQELELKRQFDKQLARKEQRIKDLESALQLRKKGNEDYPLFTFKTTD